MNIWKIKNENAKEGSLEYNENCSPAVLQILANRGIAKKEEIEKFLSSDYGDLPDPENILDIDKAVKRISEAISKKEKIAIYGDYDADGVTASALLYETLLDLGYPNVISYIPDRQLEGYGINKESIDHLYKEGVKLIVTVDCGITNLEEIKKATDLGIDVIVTDHHHVPKKLPKALAIINPNIEKSGFDFCPLAGVGVAFKLAQALYKKIKPEAEDQMKWMLDLVAIGTIADCVPLLGENRILAKYGLLVISKTKRVGLQEMFKVGRIDISENAVPDTQKVAYQIAPRINAAGRMDHASVSYELIIEKNRVRARDLALEVESKNQERQKLTAGIVREVEILAQNSFRGKKLIFAENEHWPVGILGLVAGKIADKFQKPTIILQKRDREYVGSLRSIPELDIMEVLNECAETLEKFGGHAQAAGVSVKAENIEKFYQLFSALIEKKLKGVEIASSLDVDLEIKARDIDWELMNDLKKLEPYGEGNEEPVFMAKNMTVMEMKICGNGLKHLKLSLRGNDGSPKIFDSIGFGMGENRENIKNGDKVDIVFNLRQDSWNGSKKLQLRLIDLRMAK